MHRQSRRAEAGSTETARRRSIKQTYSVRAVLRPLEGDHTVDARKVSAMAAAAMGIELFLGEDVAARLVTGRWSDHRRERLMIGELDLPTHLALEGHHDCGRALVSGEKSEARKLDRDAGDIYDRLESVRAEESEELRSQGSFLPCRSSRRCLC